MINEDELTQTVKQGQRWLGQARHQMKDEVREKTAELLANNFCEMQCPSHEDWRNCEYRQTCEVLYEVADSILAIPAIAKGLELLAKTKGCKHAKCYAVYGNPRTGPVGNVLVVYCYLCSELLEIGDRLATSKEKQAWLDNIGEMLDPTKYRILPLVEK